MYRKLTHTDLYLQWDSHHNLAAKHVSYVSSPTGLKQFALDQSSLIRKFNTLERLYPGVNNPNWLWTGSKVSLLPATSRKVIAKKTAQAKGATVQMVTPQKGPPKDKPSTDHIVMPYTQDLGESIKKICSNYGNQIHFKGNRTLKQLLVKPKDQDPIDNISGAIYMYQCE